VLSDNKSEASVSYKAFSKSVEERISIVSYCQQVKNIEHRSCARETPAQANLITVGHCQAQTP